MYSIASGREKLESYLSVGPRQIIEELKWLLPARLRLSRALRKMEMDRFVDANQIRIAPLAEHRCHIPQLARWHHRQWASLNPGETLDSRTERLERHAADSNLPITWVALDEDRVVGSASLVPSDMEIRPELGPWLASVFVGPDYRERGIGSSLVRHVALEAQQSGFSRLYLFTPDQQKFYQRLGWRARETLSYHQVLVTLMEITLPAC